MLRTKVLLTTLLIACAIFVTAAVAVAAPVSEDQTIANSGSTIRTTLQTDLTLKGEFSLGISTTPTTGIKPHGFCRCSCGYPCETSADCGGVSCDPFITCCVRGAQEQSLGLGKSTRAGEEPAVNVKCK